MLGGVGFALGEIIVALFFPESRPLSQRYVSLGLAIIEMLGFILFPLGRVLFGVGALRARVYSRLACGLVTGGIVLFLLIPVVANVLLGAGWFWMGNTVWAMADQMD